MKKLALLLQCIALMLFIVSDSYASGGHKKRHHGHWKHHKHYSEPYYYPPAGYYPPPPPAPVYQDRRTHQGLAGGVVGSVLGYEMGNGHPLATGIGAAAGSLLGNEVSGRR